MVGVLTQTLAVNDGPLTSENGGFLRASDPSLPQEELRKRYDEDGYLFLKGLLPRTDVLETRKRYFEMVAPTGVLDEGSAPVEGIFNSKKSPEQYPGIGAGHVGGNERPGGDNAAYFVDLAIEAHYTDWYADKFCNHSDLYNFVAKFTGWNESTLGFKRTLLRNNIPRTKPLGVHYDQIFLRHGEPTSVTAWVPIGDIKLDGGGLIYLEDGKFILYLFSVSLTAAGDAVGTKLEEDFTAKAKQAGMTDDQAKYAFNDNMASTGLLSEYPAEFARQNGRRWLTSSFEAGDVVLHKPHAV